jgi:biotin operon repressor
VKRTELAALGLYAFMREHMIAGVLTTASGDPITAEWLARRTGTTQATVARLIAELQAQGRIEVRSGVISDPELVRAAVISAARRMAARVRWSKAGGAE